MNMFLANIGLEALGAQELPSAIECRAWDEAFIYLTDLSIILVPLFILGFNTAFFFLPWKRKPWWCVNVYNRIFLCFVVIVLFFTLGLIGYSFIGLGTLWFSHIPPNYLLCKDVPTFRSSGILDGLLFADGPPAIYQRLSITILLIVSGALGLGAAIGIAAVVRYFKGLKAMTYN